MKYYGKLRGVLSRTWRRVKIFSSLMKRKVYTPSLPVNKDGKVYIHLGCGEINAPGFINVDATPFSHIHYVGDVEDLGMFPNKSADLIYASHILEHITHKNLVSVLREWYRVLKEGGVLRLAVPDLDKIIDIYKVAGNDIQSIVKPLMGGQDYDYNFHQSVFSDKYLRQLLRSVGFKKVSGWNSEHAELHSFDDWASRNININGRRYPISLNLEAVR